MRWRRFSAALAPVTAGLLIVLLVAADGRSVPVDTTVLGTTTVGIRDLRVDQQDGKVLLSFRLANAFDEDMRLRLESGLPTQLVYDLRLSRVRRRWFDASVAAHTLEVAATYDAVARTYSVNYKYDGALIDSRVVREIVEVRRAMTELDAFAAFEPSFSGEAPRLRVRVRAELGTSTVLLFIPRTLTTDWAESQNFAFRG